MFDPALNGRGEEIWARMVSVRERGRQLQREYERAGKSVVDGSAGREIDEEVLKRASKVRRWCSNLMGRKQADCETDLGRLPSATLTPDERVDADPTGFRRLGGWESGNGEVKQRRVSELEIRLAELYGSIVHLTSNYQDPSRGSSQRISLTRTTQSVVFYIPLLQPKTP